MLHNFFVRNLRILVIRLSACLSQAFPASSNKHSTLVRTFVNYGRKKFYNTVPFRCSTLG
jgi:hypothetical protein